MNFSFELRIKNYLLPFTSDLSPFTFELSALSLELSPAVGAAYINPIILVLDSAFQQEKFSLTGASGSYYMNDRYLSETFQHSPLSTHLINALFSAIKMNLPAASCRELDLKKIFCVGLCGSVAK